MVDYAVFQTDYVGSNPTSRNYILIRVSNLIGKVLSCHESRCRIEAGLTRLTL